MGQQCLPLNGVERAAASVNKPGQLEGSVRVKEKESVLGLHRNICRSVLEEIVHFLTDLF